MSITSLEKIKNWQRLSRITIILHGHALLFLILFSAYLDNASEAKAITVLSKEFRGKFWKIMYFPAYLWKPRIINFILSVSFLTHDYRRVGFHFCHSFFESSCVILTVLLRVGTILCTRCNIYTSSTSSCHCVKSVGIRSYCGPYSVRMQEYTDQNNSEYGHFSRSVRLKK